MNQDTRLQLGRAVAERFRIQSLDIDGDAISLSGIFRCDLFSEQTAVRDQFVAYGPHNRDEEVVPFFLEADETLSGYVTPVKVSAGSIQNTLARGDDTPHGWQPLSLELVPVSTTQFEITCDGDDRDTAHVVTPWSWVGLPLAVDVLAGPTAIGASAALDLDDVPGEDGDVMFVKANTGSKGDLYDETVLYSLAAEDFYGAAVVLEVTDDVALWDDFARLTDGPIAGMEAHTGQSWHGNAISPIGSATLVPASMPETLTVTASELVMETSNTAGYSWPDAFDYDPDEFEIEYVLTSGTTNGASGAFIVSSEYHDTDPAPIALNSVHLTHNRLGVQMFWNDGGIDPSPVTHVYASPLTADGSTVHRLKMTIDRDTNTVTVTDPDGTRTDFTDPRASRLWGRTVLVEQINPSATFATDRFVRYRAVRVDEGRRWREIVGRRMPDRPNGWRLRNSVLEVAPDASGVGVDQQPGPKFLTKTWNNALGRRERKPFAPWGTSGGRVAVRCLRNAPEAITVETVIDERTLALTLRRGAWWVEGFLAIQGSTTSLLGVVADPSLSTLSGEDGVDVTGGLDAAADDARGNKYRLRSPDAITTDTDDGLVRLTTAGREFWFGFGLDVHPDFTPYYFAAVEHHQRLT